MISLELVNAIDALLAGLAPMKLWPLAKAWSEFYREVRRGVFASFTEFGSPDANKARNAVNGYIAELKKHSMTEVATELRDVERLLMAFAGLEVEVAAETALKADQRG